MPDSMPKNIEEGKMKDKHGGDVWKAARDAGVAPGDIIDFSSNINPLGLPPLAREALEGAVGYISAYPDPDSTELKRALGRYLGLKPTEVLPANGSTALIYLIPRVLAPTSALVVEPAFSEYAHSLALACCRVEGFAAAEAGSFVPDLEKLAERLKCAHYDLLYIANPSNPAGALLSSEELHYLAGRCRKTGTVLIVDEAFADFVETESIAADAGRLANVVVLRSMTKFFSMAGLRLGFMASNEAMIERFGRALEPWSVNTLAMAAGTAALADKGYIARSRRWFDEERGFLFEALTGVPGLKVFPSNANFFLVKILTGPVTGKNLKQELLRRRILIRELGAMRGLGEEFIRVAVLKREDNEVLIDELSTVFRGVEKGVSLSRHA